MINKFGREVKTLKYKYRAGDIVMTVEELSWQAFNLRVSVPGKPVERAAANGVLGVFDFAEKVTGIWEGHWKHVGRNELTKMWDD